MKYMGSKSRICKYIVPIIQEYIDKNNIKKYWEPFVGGANVIDKIKCAKKVGSDKNKYLIALLNRMKQNGELFETVSKNCMIGLGIVSTHRLKNLKIGNWETLDFLLRIMGDGLMVVMQNQGLRRQRMEKDIEIIIRKPRIT